MDTTNLPRKRPGPASKTLKLDRNQCLQSKMNNSNLTLKRPGPASKTLKLDVNQRLQSSGNETLTQSPVINTHALSSEIQHQQSIPTQHSIQSNLIETYECLNMVPNPITRVPVSRPSGSSNSSVSAVSSTQQNIQLSCLFCSDLVPNNDLAEDEFYSQQLGDILKIVGGHLLQKYIEFPQNYSPKDVPFCATCKETILEIYEDHKIILKAQQRISNNVSKIERVVADAELLKQGSVSEKNEWTRLTDLALQGYRNKLIMKKQLRKALALGKGSGTFSEPQFCSHTIVMKDDQIGQQFKDARKNDNLRSSTLTTENNEDARSNSSYSFGMTVEENRMDIDPRFGPEQEQNATNLTTTSDLNDKDAWMVDDYNESLCTMIISDVPSGKEAANTPFQSEDLQPVVNEELWSLPLVEDQRSSNHQSAIWAFPKRRSGRPRGPYNFTCTNCSGKFPTKILLRMHNCPSPQIGIQTYGNPANTYQEDSQINECEICGRPVKGTYRSLLVHKFSHKNDDERRAAHAAGEPGSRLSLLNRRGRRRKQVGVSTAKPKIANPSSLKCQICFRQFQRRNHFENHVRSHDLSNQAKPKIIYPIDLKCRICSREFQRRNHLANHLRLKHHGCGNQANAKALQLKRYAIKSARSSVLNGPTCSRAFKLTAMKEIANRVLIERKIECDPAAVDSENNADFSIPLPLDFQDIPHNAYNENGFDLQELITIE